MNQLKYFIKTYGCQMNVHDSERMAGILESMGYSPCDLEEEADIILLNTCSVREKADHKLFTKLGRIALLKKEKEDLVVGVCGCIAQKEAEEIFKKVPFVNLVVGPRAVSQLHRLLDDFHETGERQICIDLPKDFEKDQAFVRSSSHQGFVTAMEGCNKFCTYCIVPYTRGREISRPAEMILNEVKNLAAEGYREIHLLGQNVNAYHDKISDIEFSELLERVSDIEGIKRIRFITSHPRHLTEDIVKVMAERDNICNAIHLPPQSGSSQVLQAMNRRYSREEYLGKIDLLKSYMPDIALSGDIIVGFPGETAEDFAETMSLLEQVRFASLFSFVYSVRPGTKAEKMEDNVSLQEKLDRLHQLQELQSRIQYKKHQEMIGTIQNVLFDGKSAKRDGQLIGRTEGNLVVNIIADESLIGEIRQVEIVDAGPHHLRAEIK